MKYKTMADQLVASRQGSNGYVCICSRCRAFQEWDVYPTLGPKKELRGKLYVARERVCICTEAPIEDFSEGAGDAPLRTCQTPGCVKACRFRFCLECNSTRQGYSRNRFGPKESDEPLPKCGCGVQLGHPLSKTCVECKKIYNREWHNANNARKRAAAESAA